MAHAMMPESNLNMKQMERRRFHRDEVSGYVQETSRQHTHPRAGLPHLHLLEAIGSYPNAISLSP